MITSKIRRIPVTPIGFLFVDGGVKDVRPVNKDGSIKILPIDQFPAQKFMQNVDGWVMNDIQAYENTQNESVARAILQRCPIIADDSTNDGLTWQERLQEVVPANFSSPSEFVAISKKIANIRYNRMIERVEAARVAAEAEAKKNPKIEDIQPDKE